MADSEKAVFKVGGLRDSGGAREIEHNLSLIDGVRDVLVSAADRTVRVEFDPGVIREEYLKRTLDSLGYSPYVFQDRQGSNQ
ncbi:MAG: heavy-metal-associated domain-containing protein [Bacillota bacterium]